jgi:hypothetical protein
MSYLCTNSLTENSPPATRAKISRRVGSASELKIVSRSRVCSTIWLNDNLSNDRCQVSNEKTLSFILIFIRRTAHLIVICGYTRKPGKLASATPIIATPQRGPSPGKHIPSACLCRNCRPTVLSLGPSVNRLSSLELSLLFAFTLKSHSVKFAYHCRKRPKETNCHHIARIHNTI